MQLHAGIREPGSGIRKKFDARVSTISGSRFSDSGAGGRSGETSPEFAA
jgi:hypothetical protein